MPKFRQSTSNACEKYHKGFAVLILKTARANRWTDRDDLDTVVFWTRVVQPYRKCTDRGGWFEITDRVSYYGYCRRAAT